MNPSSVSGDAAQPAPQIPLPVASPPPQPPAPAAEAAVVRSPPCEHGKFIAKQVADALPPGLFSLPIGAARNKPIRRKSSLSLPFQSGFKTSA
jgi:hypothetical protein